jgi:ferredoxin-NADP reductase
MATDSVDSRARNARRSGSERLVLRSKRCVAVGVVTLEFIHPDRHPLPAWEPGAHVDLVLNDGRRRQYSLCGAPTNRTTYRLGVRRGSDPYGVSTTIHDTLEPGDIVTVRGPRNHFRLEPAQRYLFVAGGIGITPILPMLAAADRAGSQWRLLYTGRSMESMPFLDELRSYGDRIHVQPSRSRGRIAPSAIAAAAASGALVYCCGPEELLQTAEAYDEGSGRVVRTERFRRSAEPLGQEDQPVEVVLARSGRVIAVPAGTSILDALLEAGVDALSDCRQGLCGACEVPVLNGEIDHRDHVLTPRERLRGKSMTICVSRARSRRLVLDL